MALYPSWITDNVKKSVYWADRTVRSDLAAGLIASENDYTSNLTSAIRRQVNAREVPGLTATSYVLKPVAERAVGADACIILANKTHFKICLFEAKWPRLRSHKDYWDSTQKSTGLSHFHEQLGRQSRVSGLFAIWEIFYCEYPYRTQPSFMPSHVSACVWHQDAYSASKARGDNKSPWTDTELATLLRDHCSQIDAFVGEVCACRRGQRFDGKNYLRVFEDYAIPSEVLVIEFAGDDGDEAQWA